MPYESCNLGSINLAKLVEKGEMNWERLGELVSLAVRFLDDVIDVNRFPLKQIEEATLQSRKIGLGVMGFAEMLILMNISYNSQEAVRMAEEIMKFISQAGARGVSAAGRRARLFSALRRVPTQEVERHEKRHGDHDCTHRHHQHHRGDEQRHRAALCSGLCAPRAGGRAPFGGLAPLRAGAAAARGIYTPELKAELARKGSAADIAGVPQDLKDLFVTALDIPPEQHVRIQAAFQKHTDNAVSKTVNLPESATVGDVLKVYNLAYDSGCKGVTVFRYGSRSQVLYLGNGETVPGCKYCG